MTIFFDKKSEKIELIWNKSGSLQAEKNVFIETGFALYEKINLKSLNIGNIYGYLSSEFDKEKRDFAKKENICAWVSAKKDLDFIIGYASFDIDKNYSSAYVRQIMVLPIYWNRGIGKKLIFSILDKFPKISKIFLVTKKTHFNALKFYEKIGFTRTKKIPKKFSSNIFVGFEFKKT